MQTEHRIPQPTKLQQSPPIGDGSQAARKMSSVNDSQVEAGVSTQPAVTLNGQLSANGVSGKDVDSRRGNETMQQSQMDSGVEVGYETVISNSHPLKGTIDDDGLSNRVLIPKYSHRKNAHHLLKMTDRNNEASRGSRVSNNRGGVATHLVSVENSARQIDLLPSENTNNNQISGVGQPQASRSKIKTNSSMKDMGRAGYNGHTKKNSVDQMQLKGMLGDITAKTSSVNLTQHHPNTLDKGPTGQTSSAAIKSIDSLATSNANDNGQIRLDNGVKLHELSRQQLHLKEKQLPELSKSRGGGAKGSSRNQSTDEGNLQVEQAKPHQHRSWQQHSRQSVSQLKSINESGGDQSLQAQQKRHMQSQNMTLPDVMAANSKSHSSSRFVDISRAGEKEMLIDDYNLKVMQPGSGYNKIAFKERNNAGSQSRKSIPTKPEMILKRQLKSNEGSAIRIVKRQQNKFNMLEDSIMISDVGSPSAGTATKHTSVFKSQSRRGDSAMMNGLMASSQSAMKINSKATYQTAIDRNTTSTLQQADQTLKEYALNEEKKRLRTVYEQMASSEMRVTNSINQQKLSGVVCDDLLKTNLNALIKVIVMQSGQRGSLYSADLQQFVQSCCAGIEKSAQLRQKLLTEQTELFQKSRDDFAVKEAHLTSKCTKMKTKLDERPHKRNYDKDEDREKDIEDLFLKEEKLRMAVEVANSKYSNAEDQLNHLNGMFDLVKNMRVGKLQVSYIDQSLFENKDATIGDIDDLIKNEGSQAVRTTAKKVLNNFWRYYETADATVQTEEKVVDALKAQLFELQHRINEMRQQIDIIDREKSQVETSLDQEKKRHETAKKAVRMKDMKIEELGIQMEIQQEQLNEMKEDRISMTERFKTFGTDLNNARMEIYKLNESLKSAQIKAVVRQNRIEELEGLLKNIPDGAAALNKLDNDDSESEKSAEQEEEKKVEEDVPKKKQKAKPRNQKQATSSSSKKVPASNTPKALTPKTQLVSKLDPEAEKRLRDSIRKELTQDLTATVKRKATAQANADAKANIEEITKAKDALVKIKQTKIKELESQVTEKTRLITGLERRLSQLDGDGGDGRKQQLVSIDGRGSILASVDGAHTSQMNSSQFSIVKPMVPKLEAAEQQSKTPTNMSQDAADRLADKDEVKSVSQRVSPRKVDSIQASARSALKNVEEEIELSPKLKATNVSQEIRKRPTIQLDKVVNMNNDYGHTIDSATIPRSLQSKQENSERQRTKKLDSADLDGVDNPTPFNDDKNPSTARRNYNTINQTTTGAVVKRHVRQSSIGSQVDKSLFHDSTVYDDSNKNKDDDQASQNTNLLSNNMQEKYSIQPIAAQITNNQTGESYFKTLHGGSKNPTTNIGHSGIESNELQMYQSVDVESDSSTLYNKPNFEAKMSKRQTLVQVVQNSDYLNATRPALEKPSNLYIESKQYQIRMSANATFGVDPKSNRKIGASQAGINSTRDLINSTTMQEGERMLESLNPPINQKLEHYQSILKKAYGGPPQMNSQMMLEEAKEQLDGTELKLLMLMLQMRGQYDRKGGTMVSKAAQTDGLLIVPGKAPNTNQNKFSTKKHSELTDTHDIIGFTEESNRRSPSPIRQQVQSLSHIQVSTKQPAAPKHLVEVAVQAGDDLIKAAMDRALLLEKSKHMFYAGDQFFGQDGSFKASVKPNRSALVMKAELAGDNIKDERVMRPSIAQQKRSKKFAIQQERIQRQARESNEIFLEQLEYEHSYKGLAQQIVNMGVVDSHDTTQRQTGTFSTGKGMEGTMMATHNEITEEEEQTPLNGNHVDGNQEQTRVRPPLHVKHGEFTIDSIKVTPRQQNQLISVLTLDQNVNESTTTNPIERVQTDNGSTHSIPLTAEEVNETSKKTPILVTGESRKDSANKETSRELSVDDNEPLHAMQSADYGNKAHQEK